MPSDIFAKMGDIKGESLDAKHKDEIEVLSFSWGVTNSGGLGVRRRRRGAGKATFQDLSIVHNIDKATPMLLKPARPAHTSRTRPSPIARPARASRNSSSSR